MILALYGAGAMGREFRQIAEESGEWSGIVFIDDHAESGQLQGCPVYRFQMFRERFSPEEIRFAVAIGEPKFRRESFDRMKRAGYTGCVLRHSSAQISLDAELGEGTVLCQNVFVGSQARIGRNCYVSRNASVGHDAIVGDHTRLGVNTFVGGHTQIGENAFIGASAMLKDRIQIGYGSVVALGAVVFDDVPDSVTMIGNPARIAGAGTQDAVFAPSRELEATQEEKTAPKFVSERYWEVFSGCFEGVDFNPVSFRYHDSGWDSVTHMLLISRLEEAFGISIRGREVMRIKSYSDGLTMIRNKLETAEGRHEA